MLVDSEGCDVQIKGPTPKADIGGGLDLPKTTGAATLKEIGKDVGNAVSIPCSLLVCTDQDPGTIPFLACLSDLHVAKLCFTVL